MKYIPVQPPEGINVTDEHPLKSFFILTLGTIGVIIAIVVILGIAADYLVKYVPIEYEQDLFDSDNLYIMPFAVDESDQGKQCQQYVQTLVDGLHAKVGEDYKEHKFQVVLANEVQANAFAVPGGQIVVTRGLFNSVESENGLSMILAHEMAHHYERDPLRSAGRALVVSVFLLAILGADGSSVIQNILGNTASVTNLVFSRQQESDADVFAAELLIKFYGHALGAAEFFQHIKNIEVDTAEIPSFLSTHPSTEGRINSLLEFEQKYVGVKKPLPDFLREYAHFTEFDE